MVGRGAHTRKLTKFFAKILNARYYGGCSARIVFCNIFVDLFELS